MFKGEKMKTKFLVLVIIGLCLLSGALASITVYNPELIRSGLIDYAGIHFGNVTVGETGIYFNDSKLTKAYDVVVCRYDGTNPEVYQECDVVCDDDDCSDEINSISKFDGQSIYFNGIFPIQNTLQFIKQVYIIGNYRGFPENRTIGTIFNWTSVSGDIMLNFTGLRNFQVSNLKILCNNISTIGIQAGIPAGSPTTKPKNLLFDNIVIDTCVDTNLKLGYDNDGGSAVDSRLEDVHLRYGGICLDYAGQVVEVFGGTIGGCDIGVFARRNSIMSFYGTVFSTNDVHLLYDDSTVGQYSFFGAYLEGATDVSIKQNGTTPIQHKSLSLYNTYQSAGTGNLLYNFSNMNIDVNIIGGTINTDVSKEIQMYSTTTIYEHFVDGQFTYSGNDNQIYRFSKNQWLTPATFKISQKTSSGSVDISKYSSNNILEFLRPVVLPNATLSASGCHEGAISYNYTYHVPVYSDGSVWKYMNGSLIE